ncbi:XRN 5'-3' exonuclease N-terminus-domain-containing protein [Spinellus fusiger]|nr:XRN 5'-3' exonuclease N-terminus-domain-containing protein [Spinellus fusiger]
MGIPKFFRWISERYPMSSQLIAENRIPEFDNLYLDMNGIVHNCSHNNNESVHFRITEEQIWIAIFNYVDHIFTKIKPKKVFFLAVDGVAPRAKMNQQRSRRFRTAKDAEDTRQAALLKGEVLPQEDPFDSNCITPGTDFMSKLTQQLRYFINKKMTEDAHWQGVEVILSGPDVPGEGEHKIMDYIRLSKAQTHYNPNTRHCLYGLDADLIMLGLVSHDPHFALLREEVVFGKQNRKKKASLDSTNFYLMHHSLIREYLDLEFSSLKTLLSFEYDLERIIDDFVLLALFIGNDFLPHLPNLHINEGAMDLMFNIYKRVLSKSDGYLQESGRVSMKRLEMMMQEIALQVEEDAFQAECVNGLYLAGKEEDGYQEREALHQIEKKKKSLSMTLSQKKLFLKIKAYVLENTPAKAGVLRFSYDMKPPDRKFIETLARQLSLHCVTETSNQDGSKSIMIHFYQSDESEEEEEIDEEAIAARDRVLAKYAKAQINHDPEAEAELERQEKERHDMGVKEWKANYYMGKMGIDNTNKEQLENVVCAYITGIQWVLHYYYNGVTSWGWFYPYYYAPRISDLVNLSKYQDMQFDLGTPFTPFEQLMGVLPGLSKKLLPVPYQELMTDPSSPIIDFYPRDFEIDMNGKKQDWEAVIKIPFIDERRLLEAMKAREHRLTKQERSMSNHGNCYKVIYDSTLVQKDSEHGVAYPSPLPGVFPDLYYCSAREEVYHLPSLEGTRLNKGLSEGVFLGKNALAGFPSLHTIPHTAGLKYHGVTVFQQPSKNETIVVTLKNRFKDTPIEEIAKLLLYKRVYISYPYLQEAVVIGVSNEQLKYYTRFSGKKKQILEEVHDQDEEQNWNKRVGRVEYLCSKRFGLHVGPVDVALHVCAIRGMKFTEDGALVKEYLNPAQEDLVPIQLCVTKVTHDDPRYMERPAPNTTEGFAVDSKVFFLGGTYYGALATVVGHKEANHVDIEMIVPAKAKECFEPNFASIVKNQEHNMVYVPSYDLCVQLKINGLCLSRITSSVQIKNKTNQRVHVGLSLKFESKQQKVMGYTRKNANGVWEYSEKAIALIEDYIRSFPKFIAFMKSSKNSGLLHMNDMTWTDNPAKELQAMKAWVTAKDIANLPQAPIRSEQLEKPYVEEIESIGQAYHEKQDELDLKKVLIMRIPRNVLLRPCDVEYKMVDQVFKLGHRVVYALSTGVVPLGTKGTVIAFQDALVDVIFDITFMGGTTLDGRCAEYHGLTVPVNQLLNLTQRPGQSMPPKHPFPQK